MKLGTRGSDLIKSYETLSFSAYLPTPNDVPTIGWGHTRGVKLGMTCTLTQAQQWFLEDTSEAVNAVNDLVYSSTPNVKLTQSMFDSLVSLVFNAGAGCIGKGTTIRTQLEKAEYFEAWRGFTLWRKQRSRTTGKLENMLGLARRRAKEMVLFLEDGIPK